MKWYANEAELELAMYLRAMPTQSGKSPFQYFDGATMVSYQQPHKSFEAVFCKRHPVPPECNDLRGFRMDRLNAPVSSYEVKMSGQGENSGRGVFTKVPLEKGSYLAIDESHNSLHFVPYTFKLILDFIKHMHTGALQSFKKYIDSYGFRSQERVSCSRWIAGSGYPQPQVRDILTNQSFFATYFHRAEPKPA